jgi:hypothetical protein
MENGSGKQARGQDMICKGSLGWGKEKDIIISFLDDGDQS